ncbi:MAG: flavodoxin-dependent (E)-4-hydroxy-3-methylbut-2-enyl-diphosphate synthase, partial [Muribaculaceae bacterium]|nr:flavodoxin-dependent (E)-4-hydroxy-3-methylbut-2-enyl-diphosphate synthase [Muribaculaceae bacterium]
MSTYNYKRRNSGLAKAGSVGIGGGNPIRIQSMCNTNTNDTEASVAQALRISDAGGELVRLTTQGVKEA